MLSNQESQLRLIAELQQKAMALETEIQQHRSTEKALRSSEEELKRSNQELRKANIELKKSNDKLATANEAAEVATKAKNIFLANMSHELRTPLAGIVGFAELMLDPGLTTDERRDGVDIILHNGRQLTRILNDILDLTKVESGYLEMEKIRFSISDLTSDISSVLGPLARQKGISLNITSSGEDNNNFTITSDRNKLRRILLNVVGNALKFTEQGTVDVTIQLKDPSPPSSSATLECLVKDSGPGIPFEKAQRLFQPFIQGDNSISRRYGGTGLGLFLSRQLARLLGGDLILHESKLEKGSTFRITVDAGNDEEPEAPLPVKDLKEISSTPAISKDLLRTTDPPNRTLLWNNQEQELATRYPVSILVVDDNDVNRRLMLQVLKRLGYLDVPTAANGLIAVNMASEHHYDIIFMDVQMPNMDGISASLAIRSLYDGHMRCDQPVIIALTAHAMQTDREHCLASGMDDFVSKPVSFSLLIDKLVYWASRTMLNRRLTIG